MSLFSLYNATSVTVRFQRVRYVSFGILFGIFQQLRRDGGIPNAYLEPRLHEGKKIRSWVGSRELFFFSPCVLIAINVAATNLGKKPSARRRTRNIFKFFFLTLQIVSA